MPYTDCVCDDVANVPKTLEAFKKPLSHIMLKTDSMEQSSAGILHITKVILMYPYR